MITCRFNVLALVVLAVIPLTAAVAQQSASDSCENIDPLVGRECISRRMEAKERRLAAIYPQALAAVRRNFARFGREDDRSDPDYLVRSQDAWKRFVANDCKVQAAFGGGSNPSISDREMDCYEEALDKRIEFLRQLADGSFGTG